MQFDFLFQFKIQKLQNVRQLPVWGRLHFGNTGFGVPNKDESPII